MKKYVNVYVKRHSVNSLSEHTDKHTHQTDFFTSTTQVINNDSRLFSWLETCNLYLLIFKQGVALTGRNTTGPPRAASGKLRCAVECLL